MTSKPVYKIEIKRLGAEINRLADLLLAAELRGDRLQAALEEIARGSYQCGQCCGDFARKVLTK